MGVEVDELEEELADKPVGEVDELEEDVGRLLSCLEGVIDVEG